MSTTSVVHGYLIVLEETQKNPIKLKAQLNPIKPTGAGFFLKKTRVFSTLLQTKTFMEILQGEQPEIWAQSDPPLLIRASETFDRKLWPNGYR